MTPSGATPTTTAAGLFTPKLLTVFREGYGLKDLRADAMAGLTVAIVALPLSMAIAISSGVGPERGLYTAIVGGFLVSALGGSRFQIGGPAGAFIVLVAATVQRFGIDGLLLAVLTSGLLLAVMGLLRLGTFIRYIPFPVTVGFTAGIAVIIFAGQIRELLGLTLTGAEPGPFIPKLQALLAAAGSFNPAAAGVSALTIGAIMLVRRLRPHWPAFIIAVTLAGLAVFLLHLPVATIGQRFGAMPNGLPWPSLPPFSLTKVVAILPAALSFTLLGGIESLLSAVVADSMSGARHRSNGELVAQGAANVASALFGGVCVTGTIARTATNVRAGARGPVAGMLHSVFLLALMLAAAPLLAFIPLAALAAVLAVVCWNMAEKHDFAVLLRVSRGDAAVLLATFLLVVFRDLTTGIVVGFALGALVFVHRMANAVEVSSGAPGGGEDQPDIASAGAGVLVHRIRGAFFFGSAAAVTAALDVVSEHPRAYVLDLTEAPMLDSSAAAAIDGFVRKAERGGAAVFVAGARDPVRRMLRARHVAPPRVRFEPTLEAAVAAARAIGSTAAPG